MTARCALPSSSPASSSSSITNVRILLNTLEHERYARGALLVAFVEELLQVISEERVPESTRDLLHRAAAGDSGEVPEGDFATILSELRAALVREAA